MKESPTVSVIINCLNGEKYLREAMDSVFSQTFADWEIVFFDNASTDGSGAIAQSYGEKVHYFRHSHTIKLGAARNEAIRQARGEFIAFLDCDDLWLPRHLQAEVEAFRLQPELGLVYTDTIMVRDTRENEVNRLSAQHRPASGRAFYDLVPGVYICPAMAMIPRETFWQIGGFDESYDFVEESDLFLRIARARPIKFLTEALTIYRYHGQNYSRRFIEQQAEQARFHAAILAKYPDVREQLPSVPLQWSFGHHASHVRWYLREKKFFRALGSGACLTALTLRDPAYSWRRIANFASRYFSKGRQADWMT